MKNPINRIRFFKYLNCVILISSIILSFYSFKNKNSQNKNTEYSVDLIGYLGRYPISMHLDINEANDGDVKYVGHYVYNKIGNKIKLTGTWLMQPGTRTYINLLEYVGNIENGGFELLPNSYGEYKTLRGTWFGNGKTLKVKLKKIE